MIKSASTRAPENATRQMLRRCYDRLWWAGIARIRAGKVELDPVLQARVPDKRRGLSVMARPCRAVRQNVALFLKELGRLEPDQYYYTASELHITILSLFTATIEHRPFLAKRETYHSAVEAALNHIESLQIEFAGVTASAGTVMIQGFFETDALLALRDRLRTELRVRGLGAGLDQRYRLRTAHMTVVRFRTPLLDPTRFARALERARDRPFGATTVRSLSLVENDWYMSHGATKTLKSYRI